MAIVRETSGVRYFIISGGMENQYELRHVLAAHIDWQRKQEVNLPIVAFEGMGSSSQPQAQLSTADYQAPELHPIGKCWRVEGVFGPLVSKDGERCMEVLRSLLEFIGRRVECTGGAIVLLENKAATVRLQ